MLNPGRLHILNAKARYIMSQQGLDTARLDREFWEGATYYILSVLSPTTNTNSLSSIPTPFLNANSSPRYSDTEFRPKLWLSPDIFTR